METRPGKAYPLGATFDGTGTNFAIYSSVATSVTLCLLDDDLNEMRIPMTEVDAYVWHVYVRRCVLASATATASTTMDP